MSPFIAHGIAQDSVVIEGKSSNISIFEQKSDFLHGQTVYHFDSTTLALYRSQSVANLLSQQSSVFVKSFGVNGGASLTFRGASAAQSAVLWNGVPIMNANLGISDVSILQVGVFDQISILYGGSASLLGSGNVGGALYLSSKLNDFINSGKSFSGLAQINIGSFGYLGGNLKLKFQQKKFFLDINAMNVQTENDFKYRNANGDKVKLTNAHLKGTNIILNTGYKINNNQYLYASLWGQYYNREIPPALFETNSLKNQEDKNFRSLLGWVGNFANNHELYFKTSFLYDKMHYKDSLTNLDNKNNVGQYYQEFGWKWKTNFLKSWTFSPIIYSSFNYSYFSNAQSEYKHQARPAIIGAFTFSDLSQKINITGSLRQEWSNGNANPFLWGMGIDYELFKSQNTHFKLLGSLQKTYRLPTLNELYYWPGGNDQLKPENGWSYQGGWRFNWLSPNGNWSFTQQTEIFSRSIYNWIYWLGGAIWTPHNIAKVWSRGLETNSELVWKADKELNFILNFKTLYVLSTTEQSYLPNDNSIGKQIPYTPRYSLNGSLSIHFHSFMLNYAHSYYGYRYITTDESNYTNPYNEANLNFVYQYFIKKSQQLNLQINFQNIWNSYYQVVAFRPMPGRNLQIGLQYSF